MADSCSMPTKHRIFATSFGDVYPHYIATAEKKERNQSEVDAVICWLTVYTQTKPQGQLPKQTDLKVRLNS
jgi:hypothetical protein